MYNCTHYNVYNEFKLVKADHREYDIHYSTIKRGHNSSAV
ncbi:hypothetical protein SAMN02799624_03575 [Paenibacillus sp. UNC496MF]|nr:hypothetical protein SAMN02799624_03575 [Paenibacillus sp. UNC496MF]